MAGLEGTLVFVFRLLIVQNVKSDIAASTPEDKLSQNKDEEALEAVVDDDQEEDKLLLVRDYASICRGAVEAFFAKKIL